MGLGDHGLVLPPAPASVSTQQRQKKVKSFHCSFLSPWSHQPPCFSHHDGLSPLKTVTKINPPPLLFPARFWSQREVARTAPKCTRANTLSSNHLNQSSALTSPPRGQGHTPRCLAFSRVLTPFSHVAMKDASPHALLTALYSLCKEMAEERGGVDDKTGCSPWSLLVVKPAGPGNPFLPFACMLLGMLCTGVRK